MIRQYTDKEIIHGLANHDKSITYYLYSKYYRKVLSYVCKNSGDISVAEDMLQETLINVYGMVKKQEFRLYSTFDAYFTTVYKNTWRQHSKTRKLFYLDKLPDIADENTNNNIGEMKLQELRLILKEQFGMLKDDCQAIIRMFYMEKLNMEMIAKHFGFKNSQIAKNKRYRCLMYLKTLIKQHNMYRKVINYE